MSDDLKLALKSGTELEGYRIRSVLGAGGFGVTYLADEIMLGRAVAIKEFLPPGWVTRDSETDAVEPISPAASKDFEWGMGRFKAEAQTLVSFRHHNIVGVHRYFEANGTGYLVMEHVEGQTLAQVLHPDLALEEAAILAIVAPLLDGLQSVHDKGFLHRDIKPSNIIIRKDGSPVLIDFGAARLALGQQSKSLTSIISSGYAPYEQYDTTGQQGIWTDVYALGGVLYRCMTGNRPPDAPSRVSALVRDDEDPMPATARAAKKDYSPALMAAVDRALSVREGDRPQDIAEFRSLIEADPATADSGRKSTSDGKTSQGEETIVVAAAPPEAPAPHVSPLGAPTLNTPESGAPAPSAKEPATAETGVPAADAATKRKSPPWLILVPLAVLAVAGGAVAGWLALRDQDSQACVNGVRSAGAAIDAKDLAAARRHATAARSSGCTARTLAGLDRRVSDLAAGLKAEAEQKRKAEEDARRKREAEEARRKAEAEKKRLADEARRRAEAAQKRKAEEQRKKLETARIEACGKIGKSSYAHVPKTETDRIRALENQARAKDCSDQILALIRSNLYFALGKSSYEKKQYRDCIRFYSRSIRQRNSSGALNNRAICYALLRDYEAALKGYTEAMRINARNPLYHNNRGIAYINLKDYRKAIADFDRAIELNPTYFSALYRRGWAFVQLQQYRKAVADLDRALAVKADSADAYRVRGYARLQLGQRRSAIADYRQALRLNPSDQWVIRALQRLGVHGGRNDPSAPPSE